MGEPELHFALLTLPPDGFAKLTRSLCLVEPRWGWPHIG
jgi:hypothetical protein